VVALCKAVVILRTEPRRRERNNDRAAPGADVASTRHLADEDSAPLTDLLLPGKEQKWPRSAAKGADESHVGAGMAADDVDSSCSPCRQLYQGPDALLARLAALL